MPTIEFTANFASQTHAPKSRVDGQTVRECLRRVFEQHPKLRGYVLDDQNEPAPNFRVPFSRSSVPAPNFRLLFSSCLRIFGLGFFSPLVSFSAAFQFRDCGSGRLEGRRLLPCLFSAIIIGFRRSGRAGA